MNAFLFWSVGFLFTCFASACYAQSPPSVSTKDLDGSRGARSGQLSYVLSPKLSTYIERYVEMRARTLTSAQEVATALREFEVLKVSNGTRISVSSGSTVSNSNLAERFPTKPVRSSDTSLSILFPLINPRGSADIVVADTQRKLFAHQVDALLETEALDLVRRFGEVAAANELLKALGSLEHDLRQVQLMVEDATRAGLLPENMVSEVALASARAQRNFASTASARKILLEELFTYLRVDVGIAGEIAHDLLHRRDWDRMLGFSCDAPSAQLVLAQRRVELANHEVERHKSDLLPSVELESTLRRREQDYGGPTRRNSNSAEIGLRLNWNIGYVALGNNVGRAAVQKLSLAQQSMEEEERRSSLACRSAKATLTQNYNDLALAEEQIQRAHALAAHRETRFRTQGLRAASIEELVDGRLRIYEAISDHVRAKQSLAYSQWQLGFAVRTISVNSAAFSDQLAASLPPSRAVLGTVE